MIKVEYSTLIVKNLEESVTFYRDVLGFKEGYHVDLPNGAAITIMNSEGASVELIEGKQYEVGMYSIGTDVDDLGETLEKLKKQGCNPISPIVPTSVGRQVFIQGPVLVAASASDSLWPSAKACHKMMKRLEAVHFPYPHKKLVYRYASHLLLPFETAYGGLFRVGRKYPGKCKHTVYELQKEILEWLAMC